MEWWQDEAYASIDDGEYVLYVRVNDNMPVVPEDLENPEWPEEECCWYEVDILKKEDNGYVEDDGGLWLGCVGHLDAWSIVENLAAEKHGTRVSRISRDQYEEAEEQAYHEWLERVGDVWDTAQM